MMPARAEVKWTRRAAAYAVHFYTAAGVTFAFLAAIEICGHAPDLRRVFLWLLIAGAMDATDGPLARLCHVAIYAPRIAGRAIDDIVDYLTYTFVPLLLVWRMNWIAEPQTLWIVFAMIASLFGFANVGAKANGFFLGFPSYWNVYAFYTGLWVTHFGRIFPTVMLVMFAALTLAPLRFVYPNLAPVPWRWPLIVGAAIWLVFVIALLPTYPRSPAWLVLLSAVYPAGYILLSIWLTLKFGTQR
jgi:phosphatidylcholine synthase